MQLTKGVALKQEEDFCFRLLFGRRWNLETIPGGSGHNLLRVLRSFGRHGEVRRRLADLRPEPLETSRHEQYYEPGMRLVPTFL